MANKILNKNQLHRIPEYLNLVKTLKGKGARYVSCQEIADALNLNQELVKKDIAVISTTSGIPNKGRDINQLIRDIEMVLGYDDIHNAVLIGVGSLGSALLKYSGFEEYGLKIVAAFDQNPNVIGQKINEIKISDIGDLKHTFKNYNAKIGIVCVPKSQAQPIAEALEECGVMAIWNFASVKIHLENKDIIISNTNMATSLAVLSHQLFIKKEKTKKKIENNSFINDSRL